MPQFVQTELYLEFSTYVSAERKAQFTRASHIIQRTARFLVYYQIHRLPSVQWHSDTYELATPGFEPILARVIADLQPSIERAIQVRRLLEDFLGLLRLRLAHLQLLADDDLARAAISFAASEAK